MKYEKSQNIDFQWPQPEMRGRTQMMLDQKHLEMKWRRTCKFKAHSLKYEKSYNMRNLQCSQLEIWWGERKLTSWNESARADDAGPEASGDEVAPQPQRGAPLLKRPPRRARNLLSSPRVLVLGASRALRSGHPAPRLNNFGGIESRISRNSVRYVTKPACEWCKFNKTTSWKVPFLFSSGCWTRNLRRWSGAAAATRCPPLLFSSSFSSFFLLFLLFPLYCSR